VSQRRLERLVNLTIALMATPRPRTVADIAATVPGYGEDGRPADVADEAFRRMFERDKEALREQGIPVVTASTSVWDDAELGYRILPRDYQLPDLHLDPDEAAALGLAARLWRSASLAGGVTSALRKLSAVGTDIRAPATGLAPRVDATDPAFEPLLAALRARQAVRFAYRGSRDTDVRVRRLEPWGVVSWRGRWYVVGRDRERAAERVFRLSRIASAVEPEGPAGAVTVPAGIDLSGRVAAAEPGTPEGEAVFAVRPGSGHALRQRATATVPGGHDDHGGHGGRDLVTVAYADLGRLAEQAAGLAPDVVAVSPPALRDAVTSRLRAVLA